MKIKFWISLLLIFLLSSCSQAETPTPSATLIPAASATFLPTVTAVPTPDPTPTALPLITGISSPLQGIELSDLRLITSYAYSFKYPFSEGPDNDKNHPAVDLSFYQFKEFATVVGHPIQAILPGKVVAVTDDRYPYGNSIMIETPLDRLSPELITQMKIGSPYSDEEIKAQSPCQPDHTRISWSQTSQSVYALYAHMQSATPFRPGDKVNSGEVIGAVGASGHAVAGNEHLHLEVRVGPADAKFGTISDYLYTSTEEERYNYCIWALSEIFLPINPTLFWDPTS